MDDIYDYDDFGEYDDFGDYEYFGDYDDFGIKDEFLMFLFVLSLPRQPFVHDFPKR